MQIHWNGPYDTPGLAVGVVVTGGLAYVADAGSGLHIIDVTNPAVPVRLGGYDTAGSAQDVVISGRLAYVPDEHSLQIIDVSNPAAPVLLGEYHNSASIDGVTVAGTLAYLANVSSGVAIVDVSNPAAPVRLDGYSTSGSATRVAGSGTLAYAGEDRSLTIIDVIASPDLQPATDTGISTADDITADSTPTFDVSIAAGSYFRFYRDGVQISGDYQSGTVYTTALQADGTYRYAVAAVDAAGNASALSPTLAVTIDTAIPSTPDLVPASDTGVSSSDNMTNLDNSVPEKSLQFTVGNTVAGATVTLYADGTAIGSALAEGATTTVTTNGGFDLADAVHAITARQTLPGKAESAESAALAVTIDTVAPEFVDPRWLGGCAGSGQALGVAVSGTLAYVADNVGLMIVDVSNPAAPTQVGRAGAALDVAVSGTLAYVAAYSTGLVIYDVSNPAKPVRLGTYDTSDYARGVAISGTVAYVADSHAGLQIIDVTNPAAPVRIGGYDTPGTAMDVAISGTLAYIADDDTGLVILDVSDPAKPVRVGAFDAGGLAYGVAVSGTLAYVASNTAGLQIIDVGNPAAPVRLGGYATGSFTHGVAVAGTIAYAADWNAGLVIVDVGNPAKPVGLGAYATSSRADGVLVSGTLAYVADDRAGLQIIDVSPLGSPLPPDLQSASDTGVSSADNVTTDNTPTFDLSLPAGFYFRLYRDGVKISGDFETGASYTAPAQADGTCGYTVAAVDAAGNVSTASSAISVTVDTTIPLAPDLLAVSDSGVSSSDNLTNLDNSTPEKVLQFAVGNTVAGATVTVYADGIAIGSAVAAGATTTVATNGNLDLADGVRAFTARQALPGKPESTDSAAVMVTIDTVGPLLVNPLRLGGYDTTGPALNVVVSGTVVYIADGGAGLVILDVSDPAKPAWLAALDTSGLARAVTVSGTLAYVADDTAGLQIIDVSDPAKPIWLSAVDTSGYACDVAVSGTLACVADDIAGLVIIDVSNPAAPVQVGTFDTGGNARSVAISGTFAYVGGGAGLAIVDVSNPVAPVSLGTLDTSGYAYDVTISGTRAYVADAIAGLVIVDVSNPVTPERLGTLGTGGVAFAVGIWGSLACVADNTAGLVIVDVANPAAAMRLGTLNTGGSAYGVSVSGPLVYVADAIAGLVTIDLSASPDLQAASDTGISNTDNITGDTTPTFNFAVPAGTYFRVYRDGVQIGGIFLTGTTYTAGVQADGTYYYTIAAVDAAGNVSPQSPPLAVTIDTKIPTVTNVLVGGSGWTGDFLADLNAAGSQNVGGYSIPVGSGRQLAPLGWGNIDQIKIVFNENVGVDQTDLVLSGIHGGLYDIAGALFTYDPTTFTAMWQLPQAIGPDKLVMSLNVEGSGPVQDPAGNRLDGEWTNPLNPWDTGTSTYPSGNSYAGGDFVFRFRVLPCDANQDGAVDIFDVAKLQVNYGQTSGMMPADGDFDGNGTVDIFDVALLQVAYERTLEPPAPAPAAAPGAAFPLVASQPGHSPAEWSRIAESSCGSVSGSPAEGPLLPAAMQGWTSHPWHPTASTRRNNRMFPVPRPMAALSRPLAVHHAVENASWESAVDEVLEGEGREKGAELFLVRGGDKSF
ncbi:MAG: Ig-like domain-containing protein [Pirellulales bacterium]